MTHKTHEITISSWNEFLEETNVENSGESFAPGPLFRGQEMEEWPLTPSLLRLLQRAGIDQHAAARHLEAIAGDEFEQEAHLHSPQGRPQDCLERCALMQHYGIPTRMLDWTTSPLFAAFFAVERDSGKNSAVWAVNARWVNGLYARRRGLSRIEELKKIPNDLFQSDGPKDVFFARPTMAHQRLAAQQGWFSISCDILAAHDGPLLSASTGSPASGTLTPSLKKIIIPHDLRSEFLWRLRIAGVTARLLYPGLDGFGRSIKSMMEIYRPSSPSP